MSKSRFRGFTMIELLVAIALMAILSATVATQIGPSSRQYARDTQRKADVNSIASALEMYRNDNPGYPPAADYPLALTDGGYMTAVPKDPSTTLDYTYTPGSCAILCSNFRLCAGLEKTGTDYCVNSP